MKSRTEEAVVEKDDAELPSPASGFWQVKEGMSKPEIAAVIAVAIHRGLISSLERQVLPIHD